VWSGAISFGLVTVPINVQNATEDHSIRFHQYHLEDMGRVRVRKYCEVENREVRNDEIGKGYQLTKEHLTDSRCSPRYFAAYSLGPGYRRAVCINRFVRS
jgi:non-homologous end joining protein Ku